MYVVEMADGTYVRKQGGGNDFFRRPQHATRYPTEEEARAVGKVGHHRDMGGSGFRGRAVPYNRVKWKNNHPRYREK